MLIDLRGHGASSPVPLTFGARERADLRLLLDALETERQAPLRDVGVYGPSYGGGIALQWPAFDVRVTRVLTVASFASLRRSLRPYVARTWGPLSEMLPRVWHDGIIDDVARAHGFEAETASGLRWLPRSQARHVLIHSRADPIVPYAHAEALMRACGGRCRLVPLEGVDHLGSLKHPQVRAAQQSLLFGGAETLGKPEPRRGAEGARGLP